MSNLDPAILEKLRDFSSDLTPAIGSMVDGRAITAVLFVSPDGGDVDGSTWAKAYTTIQAALDAASTDANDCTLILIAPHATYYDINTTGDPTWSGNYELVGTHRKWAAIKNTHASATSIFKFTGKASLQDLAISQQGTVNGVIFTGNGARIRHCGFNSETCTGAVTSIDIDGSAALTNGAIIEDLHLRGHVTYTTGIHIDKSKVNNFEDISLHGCLVAVHQEDVLSVSNQFSNMIIGDCALGFDIDSGTDTHFQDIIFHGNTRNIDDEIGGHSFRNIRSDAPITLYPDNFTGVTLSSDASADTWGTLTDIIAASAIDNPFRIVAFVFEPDVSQWSRIRLTGDGGTIYFDDVLFDADRKAGTGAPGGTDFVFNANTAIKGQAKVEGTGPDDIVVWLKVQLI